MEPVIVDMNNLLIDTKLLNLINKGYDGYHCNNLFTERYY